MIIDIQTFTIKVHLARCRTQVTMESGATLPIGESYRVAVAERLKGKG